MSGCEKKIVKFVEDHVDMLRDLGSAIRTCRKMPHTDVHYAHALPLAIYMEYTGRQMLPSKIREDEGVHLCYLHPNDVYYDTRSRPNTKNFATPACDDLAKWLQNECELLLGIDPNNFSLFATFR
jgi:hypothetical protein